MPPVNRILQKFLSATHFYPFPYQVSYPIASQTKNTFFRISTKLIESFLSTQIFSLFIWIKDSLKNLLYRSSSNCTLIVVIDEVQLEYPCSFNTGKMDSFFVKITLFDWIKSLIFLRLSKKRDFLNFFFLKSYFSTLLSNFPCFY